MLTPVCCKQAAPAHRNTHREVRPHTHFAKEQGIFCFCTCFLTGCYYPFFVLPSNVFTACSFVDEIRDENPRKTTISAENEVEAQKLANNYKVNVHWEHMSSFILRIFDADVNLFSSRKFGFRKWKSHVTERPFEDRSSIVKELYSELNVIKPYSGQTKLFSFPSVVHV